MNASNVQLVWKDYKGKDPNWCPGCGDFGVLTAMQKAAANVGLDPERTVLVTGIGCSGNINGYFRTYGFHGLHGRALPVATGIQLANPDVKVVAAGGDGDGFGIGLGHFMHAARRNVNLTYIVMDNQIYGLTKGQTSPTTPESMATKASPLGPMAQPLNPLSLALTGGATYVAQGFAAEQAQLVSLLEGAFRHRGFSFVNTQSPCVTYNHVNTYAFFRDAIRRLDAPGSTHDPSDWAAALRIANQTSTVPTGLLYRRAATTLGDSLHPTPSDAGAFGPVAAAGDPVAGFVAARGRFAQWLEELRLR